jgi:hypothetical protein
MERARFDLVHFVFLKKILTLLAFCGLVDQLFVAWRLSLESDTVSLSTVLTATLLPDTNVEQFQALSSRKSLKDTVLSHMIRLVDLSTASYPTLMDYPIVNYPTVSSPLTRSCDIIDYAVLRDLSIKRRPCVSEMDIRTSVMSDLFFDSSRNGATIIISCTG